MQSKDELEHWYKQPDPWQYKTTQDDLERKAKLIMILSEISKGIQYERVLDIGAGEGYVTQDIFAKEIYGIEISDLAASRFPSNVKRVLEPEGKYDLVMTTGTLYSQYNHKQIVDWIRQSASKHILVAGIKDWLIDYSFGQVIHQSEFPYRQYVQRVTMYEL
jgi:protein-L-isoaspartate O-methyltransferase